jgi:transposase
MAQTITVLGLAIAKLGFHGVGMDDAGHVVLRKRLPRRALLTFIANLPPLRIGMEAWGSAPYWARQCRERGHDVRVIAPPFIKADVQSPKHDAREAEALCEAVPRPTMRFGSIKRVEPQALHALARGRERRIKARTALVHERRGLLSEDGMIWPPSLATFRALLVDKRHEGQAKLPTLRAEVCWPLYDEFRALEKPLEDDDKQLAAIGQAHRACQRLPSMPGIGPGTATALIAALGDVPQVKNGRQLAAWLGLVPREHATGGQPRLLGISKRGARDRRKRLVHGARATLGGVDTKGDDRSPWLSALIARRGKNRAAVALAKKNARMVWALLAHNQAYGVRTVT